jgi:hypothetical protein
MDRGRKNQAIAGICRPATQLIRLEKAQNMVPRLPLHASLLGIDVETHSLRSYT